MEVGKKSFLANDLFGSIQSVLEKLGVEIDSFSSDPKDGLECFHLKSQGMTVATVLGNPEEAGNYSFDVALPYGMLHAKCETGFYRTARYESSSNQITGNIDLYDKAKADNIELSCEVYPQNCGKNVIESYLRLWKDGHAIRSLDCNRYHAFSMREMEHMWKELTCYDTFYDLYFDYHKKSGLNGQFIQNLTIHQPSQSFLKEGKLVKEMHCSCQYLDFPEVKVTRKVPAREERHPLKRIDYAGFAELLHTYEPEFNTFQEEMREGFRFGDISLYDNFASELFAVLPKEFVHLMTGISPFSFEKQSSYTKKIA